MEIKKDEKNYRVHDEKNQALIEKSLTELGAGRSILLDNSGKIIAGNGVFSKWEGRPIKIIETDGTELIAVKRKDLSPDDPRRQKLAFADNHISDTSFFNEDLLKEDFELLKLSEWDFDFNIPESEEKPELYTRNISSPHYEPSGEKPDISLLIDTQKADDLIGKIAKSNISENEKDFLIKAAYRHFVFDYGKIADYYAHSNPEVQEIMEDLALVIIDFNKAIDLGYVKLSNQIAEQYNDEYNG